MIVKSFGSATRSVDTKARTIEFVASTSAIDRYGDVIDQAGWDTKNFEKNPVFLWSHRSQDPPVGKVVQLTKSSSLVAKVEFATKAVFPFADSIFELYKNGFLNAVSVGFLPLESEPLIDETGRRSGERYTKQELLEISATPVPANPQALAKAVQRGFLSAAQARAFRENASNTEAFENFLRDLDAEEREAKGVSTLDELLRALYL